MTPAEMKVVGLDWHGYTDVCEMSRVSGLSEGVIRGVLSNPSAEVVRAFEEGPRATECGQLLYAIRCRGCNELVNRVPCLTCLLSERYGV